MNYKRIRTKNYVEHPRYGKYPIISTYRFSKEAIDLAHWRYSKLKYFLKTAIPADVVKQNYAIYPRSIYVDIEEHCEMCGRPFIFFAKEQQYWFEVLKFWVDAHCTRCIHCRKKQQHIRFMQQKYEQLKTKAQRCSQEQRQLKQLALELYQLGFITSLNKVNI